MLGEEINKEAVVHHIHHNTGVQGYRREVTINGSVFSISLCSDDPKENIAYLREEAMITLKELKEASR